MKMNILNKKTIMFARRVSQRYFFFKSSQHWGRKRIEQFQDEQLKKIIRHAAIHVPYYRKLFKNIGFNANRFAGRSDMHNIPFLDKEIVRKHQKEFLSDNAESYGINWDSTSGSTGTPLHFVVDNSTKANKLACVIRSYQWGGYLPWSKTFSIQSYRFDNHLSIYKHYPYVNLWRFDAKKINRETAIKIIEMMNRIKPRMIIGYPFSIYMIAKIGIEEKMKVPKVNAIVTAGETLSDKRRSLIENLYRCNVVDFFSHHENVSIITECGFQNKHICEDFAYNEIVSKSGKDAWHEGSGELVGTGFYNYAMPLIRYKVGDQIETCNEMEICPCGSHFTKIKKIVGRQNDFIVTPDGRKIGNVIEHSIDYAKGVVLSQCVQDYPDHIYINVIADETFNNESIAEIERGFRSRLGEDIKIDIRKVRKLEKKKSGKTPFILSKIGHDYI
jgi:phenylacetate-CoA ligase